MCVCVCVCICFLTLVDNIKVEELAATDDEDVVVGGRKHLGVVAITHRDAASVEHERVHRRAVGRAEARRLGRQGLVYFMYCFGVFVFVGCVD